MIKEDFRRKKPYVLYTSDGSRILGTHATYASALRQERAIQANKRKNPFTTESEFDHMLIPLSDEKVRRFMEVNYPRSVSDPKTFAQDSSRAYQALESEKFVWFGTQGRMLKIDIDNTVAREDNIFDWKKLSAVARAPEVFNFKIPFYVGYVQVHSLDCCDILDAMEDSSLFPYYDPSPDDRDMVYFELRDGNHRTLGALLSGDSYAYVDVDNFTMDEYDKWVAEGRPKNAARITVYEYLDKNLISVGLTQQEMNDLYAHVHDDEDDEDEDDNDDEDEDEDY